MSRERSQPFVSIIIPCRNEEKFIDRCLSSIIANDFPQDRLEMIVVDGMSQDRTRSIIQSYALQYPFIRLLDNEQKVTPAALNVGIKSASGQIIMRMDAHATYDHKYISRCVKALDDHNVDNVGGIWKIVPRTDTLVGKAIARCLCHRFGIGNAHYRTATSIQPKLVDTVPFFCCRKDVFERVGTFNERLVRGQDLEFNLRLRKSGGRTLLIPEIVSYYYARSDMKSFWKQNWANGVWAIIPFFYSAVTPVSWRHLVPLFFVLQLVVWAALAPIWPVGLWMLLVVGGSYTVANLAASAQVGAREHDLRYMGVMPVVFANLHFGYGLGSLWGLLKSLAIVGSSSCSWRCGRHNQG